VSRETVEVVGWLIERPEGIGGLAIDDAISSSGGFEEALRLARRIGKSGSNKVNRLVIRALRSNYSAPDQTLRIQNFERDLFSGTKRRGTR
tara:strand:+ start:1125 stop:1397 length:273 start_codon:yes stop_codon:yes gene_type:complete